MNETMMREKIHQAVDSHCAHLKEDYWLAQRVIAMAKEPETQPVVRRRKLPVALIVVLVLVLLAATATATTLIWQQYVARVAQLEYQQGDYEKWPAEDRIGLAKDLIQMGYFDEATECARLLSVETPEEERLALADELLLTLIGQDDVRAINLYSLTYAIMGYEDFWTPAQRVWWQGIFNMYTGDVEVYTYVVPDDSTISEGQAIVIAKAAIIDAYQLSPDALDTAQPVADLYITEQHPDDRRWHVRFNLYRNNDRTEHFVEKRYEVVLNGEGNIIDDPDRNIKNVYDVGARAVAESTEVGIIPTRELYLKYADQAGGIPFWRWPYDLKAAYSTEVRSLLAEVEGTDWYDPWYKATNRQSLWFVYGLPDENALSYSEAVEAAKSALTQQLSVSDELLGRYTLIYSSYDITDAETPVWKFIFIDQDDWYSMRYRVQIEGITGTVILTETFPWDMMLQDDEYDKKYY